MRCYFMRDGHIGHVEILPEGISDTDAIERSKELFETHPQRARYDGFELWHETRYLYRWPPDS
jgi:hypothetical protein